MPPSMLTSPASPKTMPRRASSASGPGNRPCKGRNASSLASTTDGQRRCFAVPRSGEPEQSTFVVEEYEMDAEASGDNVAGAETTLARLLVKLWRARQSGPHVGAAADGVRSPLDLLEPGCPDLSERRVP